jgi:hypothetical protein
MRRRLPCDADELDHRRVEFERAANDSGEDERYRDRSKGHRKRADPGAYDAHQRESQA